MHIPTLRHCLTLALVLLAMQSFAEESGASNGQEGYHVLTTFPVGGEGRWDLLTVDPIARRLYIARTTRVMVIDADSGKRIGEIPGSGVHGTAIVTEVNKGLLTNGKEDTVTIFDTKTLDVIGKTKVGKKPDAIIYDPASKNIFVCNNGGTSISVLAPADGHVVATIEVGGAPELIAVDGKGRLYTNLEDKNELGVVDTLGLTALAHWSLAPGDGPSGVAVDPEHHRVISVCHGSKTVEVLDTDSGKVIATLPIGAGADGAAFDASTGNFFSPNADGTLTVIHEDGPDTFVVSQTATTKLGARQIALDDKTHHAYLVTADQMPAAPGDSAKAGRRDSVPNSFVVLVVGK